jgi:hypothetical protein
MFAASPAYRMLQRFWSYLFFLRRSFPADTARSLDDCRMLVELALPVLQAITTLVFSDEDLLVQINANHKKKRGKAEQLATSILHDQKRILEVAWFTNSS